MPSSQSFSIIHRRISLSPEPAAPVKSGEPLKTISRRPPPSSGRRSLLIMCCKNRNEPPLILGRTGAEPAGEP